MSTAFEKTCKGESLTQLVEKKLGNAAAKKGKVIDWLCFKDIHQSLAEDKAKLKESPLLGDGVVLHFLCCDVRS